MKKILFWLFNTVVRTGEAEGFIWTFRRFSLDIKTVSGNFRCRFTADEHPYLYLLSGKDDDNIVGFCRAIYSVGKLLTTDQQFVNDIHKALRDYQDRKSGKVVEDDVEEAAALQEVKEVQEFVEKPKKERKKIEKRVDKRFKKVVKDVQKDGK